MPPRTAWFARSPRWIRFRCSARRCPASGSATLSWCHLAAARIDVLISPSQKMWDYAAGALIAHEAGASLSTLDEDDFWETAAFVKSPLAARGAALLAEWRDWIRAELRS